MPSASTHTQTKPRRGSCFISCVIPDVPSSPNTGGASHLLERPSHRPHIIPSLLQRTVASYPSDTHRARRNRRPPIHPKLPHAFNYSEQAECDIDDPATSENTTASRQVRYTTSLQEPCFSHTHIMPCKHLYPINNHTLYHSVSSYNNLRCTSGPGRGNSVGPQARRISVPPHSKSVPTIRTGSSRRKYRRFQGTHHSYTGRTER